MTNAIGYANGRWQLPVSEEATVASARRISPAIAGHSC
jgi:hypothetical protein